MRTHKENKYVITVQTESGSPDELDWWEVYTPDEIEFTSNSDADAITLRTHFQDTHDREYSDRVPAIAPEVWDNAPSYKLWRVNDDDERTLID